MAWLSTREEQSLHRLPGARTHTLGLDAGAWRVLGEAHRRRNLIEYEGFAEIDNAIVEATFRVATLVLERVERLGPIAQADRS